MNPRKFIFCDERAPTCEKQLELDRKMKPQFDNFIFKTGNPLDIDDNYFGRMAEQAGQG